MADPKVVVVAVTGCDPHVPPNPPRSKRTPANNFSKLPRRPFLEDTLDFFVNRSRSPQESEKAQSSQILVFQATFRIDSTARKVVWEEADRRVGGSPLILGYEISFRNLSSPMGRDWDVEGPHMEKYNWKRRKTFTPQNTNTLSRSEGPKIADAYKVLYKDRVRSTLPSKRTQPHLHTGALIRARWPFYP